MRTGGRILTGILGLFMLMTASGCYGTKADDLYRLPQPSRDYLQLQKQIDAVLDSGAEYSPPVAGPNKQSVQLKDVDGDGLSEAIAFFRMAGDKPLKIYILKQSDGTYETTNKIEGSGAAIESIRYADMDADGVSELVIGWQMTATLSHMTVYSIQDNEPVLLAESDYSKIVTSDLDGDGRPDVIALRLPSPEVPGEADMFMLRSDGEVVSSRAVLSAGFLSVSGILKGSLYDGTSALFVEGEYQGGGIITDILCWQDGGIFNVFTDAPADSSEETVRAYDKLYSTDINKDGVIEIPSPRLLVSPEDKAYYVIDWYSYNRSGHKKAVYTTYHNYQDGWYLILPDTWKNMLTVQREDTVAGERTIVFKWLTDSGEPGADFLKIYALSGDNKEDRAGLAGRDILLKHGDVIYAAEVLDAGSARGVTTSAVAEGFELINPEWNTGVY